MDAPVLVVIVAVVIVAVVVVAAVVVAGRSGARRRAHSSGADESVAAPVRPRAAIVYNPTKLDDLEATRADIGAICGELGWAEPSWLATTVADPGTGQAREAVGSGVDLVCPLGGDGTVRAVSAGLIDTDVPLGLLPGGTGNLLARNLKVPIDSLAAALRVALTGDQERIDVGTVNVALPQSTQDVPKDYTFLVMAGIGFDASVMADAPEKLKAAVGWPAYVVSGLKHLGGQRFGVEISIDGGRPQYRRVQTVLVGNVGRIQGGVQLLPDAQATDGHLDAVVLSPKGPMGWASVAVHIATRRRRGHRRVEHLRVRTLTLRLGENQEVQLDGDPIGPGEVLTIAVKPRCLTVRIPWRDHARTPPASSSDESAAAVPVTAAGPGRRE